MIPETEMMRRESYLEKPLPSSAEAERVILGAILLDNSLITQAIESELKPDDFYSPLHRRIYAAMVWLFERGERIDPILIGEELKKDGAIESIGGIATITNLTYGLPHFSDIYDYSRVVKDKSISRNFIKACNASVSAALAEDEIIGEVIDDHEQAIFEIRSDGKKQGFSRAGDIAKEVLKDVQANARKDDFTLSGLSTGFRDLNEKTSGLQEGDLIILAGRPSMGKTSCALNICLNATDDDREAVIAIFSLETSKKALTKRLVTQRAKVDSHRFKTGYLTKDEWGRVAQATADIDDKNILIDDNPALTALEISAKARRLYAENKRLDLIVIDHLGWIKPHTKESSKHHEIGAITKALKALAKLLKVPVVLLSQLSRAPEARNPPRPKMSDLRESGNIEEDADVVAFLYREDYYKPTEENQGIAELIISKQREGPTGTVKLAWLAEFTTFENYYGDYDGQ